MESGLKLLPCPWCEDGGDLTVDTWDIQPDNWWSGHVRCTDCDAQGASPGEWLGDAAEAEAAAVLRWNTRTRAPSDAALVEALRNIAFLRPGGPTSNKLAMQMERIAIDALDALAAAKGQQPALDRNTVNGDE